jgi:hypothetical protein
MATPDTLGYTSIPLTHGSGAIPPLGFGTLVPVFLATKQATKTALEVGFRPLDCVERYSNEEGVCDAMQEAFKAERFSERTYSLPRSYGTPTIVQGGSNRPSSAPLGLIRETHQNIRRLQKL